MIVNKNTISGHFINGIVALLTGVMFGTGLVVSGMVRPEKVIGFLDVTGNWDMSLAFVMGGALLVFMPGYYVWVKPRSRPIFAQAFSLPTYPLIDVRLLVGATIFGVGWGLAGICPGPAIVNLAFGSAGIWIFFASMMVGLGGTSFLLCKLQQQRDYKPAA